MYHKLPPNLFKVKVPILATYDEVELELYGVSLTTVDGDIKKNSYLEMTTVMINLDRIINIYIQGYPISIVNQNDSSTIYKILEDYLLGIDHNESYSPNRIAVKDDRLEEIDKFANEIFGLNRNTIIKNSVNVNNGFDLGFKAMNSIPLNTRVNSGEKVGLLAAYEDNNSLPEVDYDAIKRRSLYRRRDYIQD